jgi:nitrate/nitrite transporter NarK
MYFCGAYGWYFNITYLPKYLESQLGVDPKSGLAAVYQGGPLWLGAFACLAGGWLTDWFIRRTGNRKWGRRLFGLVGHGLCAVCSFSCFLADRAPSPVVAFTVSISLAAFFNDLTMGATWSVCQDIGKRYSAIVAGAMNTIGNFGGAAATWVTGTILGHYLGAYALSQNVKVDALTPAQKVAGLHPGYQISFFIFGLVYTVAALLWLRINATEPVFKDGE